MTYPSSSGSGSNTGAPSSRSAAPASTPEVVVDWQNEKVVVDGESFDLWQTLEDGSKYHMLSPRDEYTTVLILIEEEGKLKLIGRREIKETLQLKEFEEEVTRDYAEKLIIEDWQEFLKWYRGEA